jgi:hypothetical protein
MTKASKGNPKIDAMTEEDLARFYEDHKDDVSLFEKKPVPIRARRGSPSTLFSLRLAPEELIQLQEAAVRQGRTVSDIIRTGALKEARGQRAREALREAHAKALDLADTLARL